LIQVTKTYLPDRDKYKAYVDEIFDSGWLTNNGAMIKRLQERLCEYLGVKNLLLVANGTLALQLAYKLLNLNGEVITTPFSFVATTSSLVWEGVRPVFVDIDPETLCIDPDQIEEKITEQTTGIVATHVYGNPCNIEKIEDIASKHGLKTVYDAAHAFGIRYNGNSIYQYGDVSIASFHSTKIFHTIEGGALIIRDDALYERARKMINFGIESPVSITELGINAKMNEFQAAMGLCVLDDVETILNGRKIRYDFYVRQLADVPGIRLLTKSEKATNNYSHFPMIFETEELLLKVIDALNGSNIYPRRYFYPSLNTLLYLDHESFMPISEDISRRILCLPLFDSLQEDDQIKIINIVKALCENWS
jgi:dTDP-4-amino-4,6-dideoxygalactose transaminase